MKYLLIFGTVWSLFFYILETIHPDKIALDKFVYAFITIILLIITCTVCIIDEIKKLK